MHHDSRHKTGGDIDRVLHPEHGHVQNQIPHGAATDAGNDGKPHERHHVEALARSDERSGHGEYDGREDVEEMNQSEQVRGVERNGLHKTDRCHPIPFSMLPLRCR